MSNTETLQPTQREQLSSQVCWELLERVAASSHMQRASRLRELLLYLGQISLRDGSEHVSEQEIGVSVFGRPDTYDSSNDSIVRTTMSSLRKRIDAYFADEGQNEPIVMEIPRGTYIPVFYSRSSRAFAAKDDVHDAAPQLLSLESERQRSSWTRNSAPWAAGVVITILAVTCILLWNRNREAQHSMTPWKYEPVLSSVWSSFLAGDRDTDVVMEDSSILLLQTIDRQNVGMDDYINKSYIQQKPSPPAHDQTDHDRDVLLIEHKTLGKQSDFRISMGIRALDPGNPRLHFYNAREYTPQLLQHNNVILMGSPTSNPWYQWFDSALNFTEIPIASGARMVINRAPKAGESATYTNHEISADGNKVTHCVVAYLPKPDHSGNMLLIQGNSSEATEAGGRFLMSEPNLAEFAKQLHVKQLPYFEAVLHVSQITGSAVSVRVEAYRSYPE